MTTPPKVEELSARTVQLRGSTLARAALRLIGWTLVYDGLPARQGVVVLYPHTSNWDFPVALLAKWSIGLPVRFWGKDTLFDIPLFGRWLRWLGGIPVQRHAPQGIVGPMVERLREARARDEFFWLALAPEGTRRLTEGWRSGFFQVAVRSGVPLALAFLDFPSRRVGLAAFVRLTGDAEVDMAAVRERLGGYRGKRPEQAAPIRWRG